MEIVNAKSMLLLPWRVRRQMQAEEEDKKFFKRLLLFAYFVGVLSAIIPTVVLWASAGHLLVCLFFGFIVANVVSGLIYAWLPWFFVARAR